MHCKVVSHTEQKRCDHSLLVRLPLSLLKTTILAHSHLAQTRRHWVKYTVIKHAIFPAWSLYQRHLPNGKLIWYAKYPAVETLRFIRQGVGGLKCHGVMSRVKVNLLWPEITLWVARSFKLGSFICSKTNGVYLHNNSLRLSRYKPIHTLATEAFGFNTCAKFSLIARFMGPTWGPSGADRIQVGPMLAPWPLLSGYWGKHEI